MKKTLINTKNFVLRHQGVIAMGATLGTLAYFQARGIKNLNAFLVEKNLFNEYYEIES